MENTKIILEILATPFYLEKGSSIRARSNLVTLGGAGYMVDLMTYPVGNDIKIPNINIIRANIPFYKKTSAGPSLSKIYADIFLLLNSFFYLLMNRKRIWYIQGEDCEGGFIGLILAKVFRKRYVYAMVNPFHETLKPYTKNRSIIRIFEIFDVVLEKYADGITMQWRYEEERIKKRDPDKKVIMIPDIFPADEEIVEELFNLKGEYIVYSGNSKRYQGLELLIESFREFKKDDKRDVKLVLVGDISYAIQMLIKKLGLEEDVILTGIISLEKTNYAIKNSLFCILPRIIDGPPGLKALHYFFCGKTILATNLSCNHKLIEHNKTGYIVDKTIDSLCDGLKKMSENINFRVQLEHNVKSNITEQMNLDDNELFAFISSVCG